MRLGHIGLTCADLDRSEKFYRELFGFETFFRIRRNTPWLAAQVGYPDADIEFCHMRGCDGLHLELLQYHWPLKEFPLDDNTYRPGNVHINIWVEDAQGMADKVSAWRRVSTPEEIGLSCFAPKPLNIEASTITDGPQKGGKGFYMRDPDGHTIEIWQPAPGNAFGKDSLPPELAKIIDGLEAARARQNTNWMDIVRLVYRRAPDEAKALFRKIEAQDAEILRLAQSSADAV